MDEGTTPGTFWVDVPDDVALDRYRTLVNTVDDGIYQLGAEGRFVAVNETIVELTGYTREELVGEYVSLVLNDEDINRIVQEVSRRLTTGEPQKEVFEFTAHTADDGQLPCELRFSMLMEDGEFQGTIGIVRDISERKRAEQIIRGREQRRKRERWLEQYRALTEAANDVIVTIDDTSTIHSINPAVTDVFGYGAEELIGESLTVLMPDEFAEPHREGVARYIETGERTLDWDYIELPGEHANGNRIPLALSFSEAEYDGEHFFTGIIRDITARKKIEQHLEKSNERLEQFAYAASHDLQEPLRMVSSYLQLIERRYADELDEDGEEFIDFAVDGAERMREMIESLLEYSRIDTRGDPFEVVDLNAVLEDVRQDLQVKVEETGAAITAENLPCVYGDRSQLSQVFQNLLSNAIEYSGEAPPRIHVAAEQTDNENKWAISVRDEGIGIDPDDADRVFEVFQSLQGHDDAGTGIGLALVERIVERHDGDIWVDSEPGEGTTFSFILPKATNKDT